MIIKKPPQKPTNLISYDCDVTINKCRFLKLEISPYYKKHNQEYLESLKRKGIISSVAELAKKMITNELIRELVEELDGEKVDVEGRYYHWSYYSFRVFYKGFKAYKLVWCVADNEPTVLGLMDCYRQGQKDRSKLEDEEIVQKN